MNVLLQQLKKYGSLTLDLEEELLKKTKHITKQKGDFFLKQGQIVSNLFVIEEGLVRAFYKKDDREITVWFGLENMILGSVIPLFFNLPSLENIQFLEDSSIYYISREDMNELYQKYHQMEVIGRKLAEEYCKILEERVISLQTESAEERYHTLLKNEPKAAQRISLGHIASYLGIAQETLSRIRKK
ncbi:Crp/Fnr family transcriptional regulator [Sphingobacterium sp. SRCM116780]|uniref:Crp/Fnr family transcriptional regulator n=1 Tax=Sphingobacterium sp. SRCM116780 TaxID=2907623 RepID=UPI001F42BB93|nr:Crp/Fnr family transcriptional regulator [Sphingobacterium sp. SRCM116780]UIR57998.1 Crp/Fnr family transcriptional regulator [Sphingobacterium sp. SRCM116780]